MKAPPPARPLVLPALPGTRRDRNPASSQVNGRAPGARGARTSRRYR